MDNISFFLKELTCEAVNTCEALEDFSQLDLYHNVKSLQQILHYYKVNTHKMLKNEMIQMLILFESEPQNNAIVYRRRRLWENIKELKADAYFSKFIYFIV